MSAVSGQADRARTSEMAGGRTFASRASPRFDPLLRAGSLFVFQNQPFQKGRDRAVFRSRQVGQPGLERGGHRNSRGFGSGPIGAPSLKEPLKRKIGLIIGMPIGVSFSTQLGIGADPGGEFARELQEVFHMDHVRAAPCGSIWEARSPGAGFLPLGPVISVRFASRVPAPPLHRRCGRMAERRPSGRPRFDAARDAAERGAGQAGGDPRLAGRRRPGERREASGYGSSRVGDKSCRSREG